MSDMDNMNSVWGIIGIIVLICGVYALYAFIKMKTTGEINASLLLGKEYTYKKCKNKDAYVKKAGPALLVFGIFPCKIFIASFFGYLKVYAV